MSQMNRAVYEARESTKEACDRNIQTKMLVANKKFEDERVQFQKRIDMAEEYNETFYEKMSQMKCRMALQKWSFVAQIHKISKANEEITPDHILKISQSIAKSSEDSIQ